MTKHAPATPLPWEYIESNASSLVHVETSTDHSTVCSITKKRVQDAAFIVHACNNYAALVEALKEISGGLWIERLAEDNTEIRRMRNNAIFLLRSLGELDEEIERRRHIAEGEY